MSNKMGAAAGLIPMLLLMIGLSGCDRRPSPAGEEHRPVGSNPYQLVTGDVSEENRARWDAIYNTQKYVFGKDPAEFLRDHVEDLPVGRALDIAMGEGRNAVFLAKKGFSVDGVDISEVALRKARRLARENNVTIHTINADLSTYVIRPEYYDTIVNIDFLSRPLVPKIKKGLRKGGMVVFENRTVAQLRGPKSQNIPREWLLEENELRQLFEDFEIVVYSEKDGVARLIARKPSGR